MTNLLPEIEKKKIRKEYLMRFFSVFLFFLFFTAVIGCISLMPSFFFTKIHSQVTASKLDDHQIRAENDQQEELYKILSTTQEKLSILDHDDGSLAFEKVLRKVTAKKSSGIRIERIVYASKQEDVLGEISIYGHADRRQDLIDYAEELKKNPLFNDLNLPVSSLARSLDIQFLINVKGEF
jgi:hypothetical protein